MLSEWLNFDRIILLGALIISITGTLWVVKTDWKRYGMLYVAAAFVGTVLCIIFVYVGYYEFPVTLVPILKVPIFLLLTLFPFYVLFGVKYSPKNWLWKIPFYWAIVHVGIFFEALLETYTNIIKFRSKWDLWDSYTWWWIFLLVFESVGGLIVPDHLRKPIDQNHLNFGKLGWFILHFVLITTIFLAGYYVGKTT